jgi:hypothetical protein
MTKIVTEMHVREVSFVSRPAGVETRVLAMSVDTAELQEHLGPAWKPGMPVSCDRCLGGVGACEGFHEFDPDAIRKAEGDGARGQPALGDEG